MRLESELFKRRVFLPEKLAAYGFTKEGAVYSLTADLCDGFFVRFSVSNEGTIDGKVYDKELSEEYTAFQIEGAVGSFVGSIKEAYLSFLSDIAEKTTYERVYLSDQANRLDAMFSERFGVTPEFMWKRFPHFGVYRNQSTRKWFAIVMNIAADKLAPQESSLTGEIEVVNFNLGDFVPSYLEKGVFPSYHMSKKNWVSVPLNDTISDALLAEMAEISFARSEKSHIC